MTTDVVHLPIERLKQLVLEYQPLSDAEQGHLLGCFFCLRVMISVLPDEIPEEQRQIARA